MLFICNCALYAQARVLTPHNDSTSRQKSVNLEHKKITPKFKTDVDIDQVREEPMVGGDKKNEEKKTDTDSKKKKKTARKKAEHERLKPNSDIEEIENDTTSTQSIIYLERSNFMRFDEELLPNIQMLIGDVVLRHDSVYLYCDSAHFNQPDNSFDAFGNVVIEQGDTLTIYADKLFYDGNSKIADLNDNVVMENNDVILNTDTFTYDRNQNLGYYLCGGTIQDSINTLTSKHGYYWSDTKIAEFKLDVVGVNDSSTLYSDTLTYNTESKIATILGPTIINYDNNSTILYSELGWYNTSTNKSQLLKESKITHNDGKILIGDTIYYDKNRGIGKAFHNVELIDTANSITLYGHYGLYQEDNEIGLVTDSALMVEYSSEDKVYVHADTLYTYAIDEEENMVLAYHNARLFNVDAQGVCDSLTYFTGDSILVLMQLPILWTDGKQITGDTVKLIPKDGSFDHVHVINNAFIVIEEDTVHYNQISGKEIFGYIADSELKRLEVIANVQSIIYPVDEGEIIGLNSIESSYMNVYFKDGKLDKMNVFPAPKATLYPIREVTEQMQKLSNFSWQIEVRPAKWQDVFLRPKRATQAEIDAQKKAILEEEKDQKRMDRKSGRNKEEGKEGNDKSSMKGNSGSKLKI